jgi:TMEM175 potassium channel family protein
MGTARLETFADGVFAIAATLLILNVDSQVGDEAGDLGSRLLHIWPSYGAYAISFVTIGIMWANHHQLMAQVDRCDRRLLIATVGLLLCIAFAPFPTRLVAEHLRDGGLRAAALTYGFTMTATAIFFNVVWLYASRGRRLLREDADPRVVSGITRTYLPGPWIYLGSTLVAFASAEASVALFAALALLYVVESSIFGRVAGEPDAEPTR